MLETMSKMELVALARKVRVPMGDYARKSKADVLAMLLKAHSREVLEEAAFGAPVMASTLLTAGVTPTTHAPAVLPVHAPVYEDIKPIGKATASKVFGLRSLSDVEVTLWNDPGAPEVNPAFRFVNAKHLKLALTAIERQRPVWLGGPAGTGKTEFVKQVAARLGRGFVRVQFDASLEAYHVIGGERVKAASTVWQDGLVLQGYRRPGAIILLDEVGFARPEYTSSLHAAIEPAGIITVPETGEVVRRAPGVTFFAADNSNGRGDMTGVYKGVQEQNNAFLNRFSRFITFTYLPAEEEASIIAAQTGANPALSRLIADFLSVCRSKADTGALESPPTMREAFYLAEALLDGIAPRDAYEATVVARAPIDCQEILQQLWAANVNVELIEQAMSGVSVTLLPATPIPKV